MPKLQKIIRHTEEFAVESLVGDDGDIEAAYFSGPNAEQRATEYARWKYGEFEIAS